MILLALDQIGAGFGVLTMREAIADRVHPSPTRGRLDHGHRGAVVLEVSRGRQAGEPRARDDDGFS